MSPEKKLTIGLTGLLGSGKTTAARQFERLGCAVISADKLDREVLGLPGVIEQIERWWGSNMLDGQGRVDRAALGRVILKDKAQLQKLVNVVHPLIRQREQELMEQYHNDPASKAIVREVPWLFETNQQNHCDAVVLVVADDEVRRERISRTRNWAPEKIKRIEDFNLALDIKKKMSDYILPNNSTITDLNKQVAQLLFLILKNV